MKALQEMVIGCGMAFQPYMTRQLLDCIFAALTHANRFIREAGFYVCSSLVSCGVTPKDGRRFHSSLMLPQFLVIPYDRVAQTHDSGASEDEKIMSEANPICVYGEEFCQHLAKGLADNWSQVGCLIENWFFFCLHHLPHLGNQLW